MAVLVSLQLLSLDPDRYLQLQPTANDAIVDFAVSSSVTQRWDILVTICKPQVTSTASLELLLSSESEP